MRWGCIAVAIAGCSFNHGVAGSADSGVDAPVQIDAIDASADTPVTLPSCYARWLDHSIHFGSPVAISELNTAGFDRDPFLSEDELTVYVSSARAGSQATDVWTWTRPDLGSPFANPGRATAFDSADSETKVSITKDGTIAVIGSDRTGGAGGIDVWMATRSSTTATWSAMGRGKVMAVETTGNEQDPEISADGLHLYFAPDPSPQELAIATRAAVSNNFGTPSRITELNSGMGDADPTVTEDERIILFSSGRTLATAANGNVWYATRANKTATWGTPMPVPDINSDNSEGDPHLSSDGCRIYFGRYVDATTDWDIYVATASNAQ